MKGSTVGTVLSMALMLVSALLLYVAVQDYKFQKDMLNKTMEETQRNNGTCYIFRKDIFTEYWNCSYSKPICFQNEKEIDCKNTT